MSNSRSSKEEELTEENLFDKFIVDPNGDILGKCIGVVINKKNRKQLRIAVKTELDSYFEIEQTIPEKLIKQIGEIILLKKEFEIPSISAEDIVTFEVPEETSHSEDGKERKEEQTTDNNYKTMALEKEKSVNKSENEQQVKKQLKSQAEDERFVQNTNSQEEKPSIDSQEEKPSIDSQEEKPSIDSQEMITSSTKKEESLSFDEWFVTISQETNKEEKEKQINQIIEAIKINFVLGEKVTNLLLKKLETKDLATRLPAVNILEKIVDKFPELIIPKYERILLTTYTELNIEIQEQLIKTLSYPLLSRREEVQALPLEKFFEELIILKSIGKNSHLTKIHKINLKLFTHDLSIQQILVYKYLKTLFTNQEQYKQYLNYLSDFNSLVISLALFSHFSSEKKEAFFNIDFLTEFLQQSFIDSIRDHLQLIDKADITQLNKLTENYYGTKLSKKIIEEIIKRKVNEVMASIDIIPSNVLFSYFQKEEKEVRSIIFDLISRKELEVKFAIIDNKEFFKPIHRF